MCVCVFFFSVHISTKPALNTHYSSSVLWVYTRVQTRMDKTINPWSGPGSPLVIYSPKFKHTFIIYIYTNPKYNTTGIWSILGVINAPPTRRPPGAAELLQGSVQKRSFYTRGSCRKCLETTGLHPSKCVTLVLLWFQVYIYIFCKIHHKKNL